MVLAVMVQTVVVVLSIMVVLVVREIMVQEVPQDLLMVGLVEMERSILLHMVQAEAEAEGMVREGHIMVVLVELTELEEVV